LPKHDDSSSSQQWQTSIQLLRLLQSDYNRARKQLEDVCRTFDTREQRAGEYLRSALEVLDHTPAHRTADVTGAVATVSDSTTIPFILISQVWDEIINLAPLRVYCLGSFEVSLDRNKVQTWRSLKAKSLLKYLILQQGHPVPKDVLMEVLWPECDPRAANNNLKATVHALRQTLNPNDKKARSKENISHVLFFEGNYIINPHVELWVDVNDFEQHWMEGKRLDREGKADEATREYELAEQLYRGDYLEEDSYEEWTLVRREALKDIYLTILSKLSKRSIDKDNYDDCIDYCHKILAKDSCREDSYRRLMRCHSKLGQRSSAVNWYNLCRKTLRTELDTVPDHQTTALYNCLLQGEPI